MVQDPKEEIFPIFCFGSNSNQQIRQRVQNDNIISTPAYLENWHIAFGQMSYRWMGGCATIKKIQQHKVFGSLVRLSESELMILDSYEACDPTNAHNPDPQFMYRREYVEVVEKQVDPCTQKESFMKTKAQAYMLNNNQFFKEPSEEYRNAINKNLLHVWGNELLNQEIQIIRADNDQVIGKWSVVKEKQTQE